MKRADITTTSTLVIGRTGVKFDLDTCASRPALRFTFSVFVRKIELCILFLRIYENRMDIFEKVVRTVDTMPLRYLLPEPFYAPDELDVQIRPGRDSKRWIGKTGDRCGIVCCVECLARRRFRRSGEEVWDVRCVNVLRGSRRHLRNERTCASP